MTKNFLLLAATVAAVSLMSGASFANECKADADCKGGDVCILAMTPPQCKPPQAAGAACKRDAVCVSHKCDIPAGKDVGVCK